MHYNQFCRWLLYFNNLEHHIFAQLSLLTSYQQFYKQISIAVQSWHTVSQNMPMTVLEQKNCYSSQPFWQMCVLLKSTNQTLISRRVQWQSVHITSPQLHQQCPIRQLISFFSNLQIQNVKLKLILRTTQFKSFRKHNKLQINKYDTPAVLENSNQSFLLWLKYIQFTV